MKFPSSLRGRIQTWYGLLLLLVIVGFCAFAYRLQADNLLRQARTDLQLRLDLLVRTLARGGPGKPSPFDTEEVRAVFPENGGNPFYYAVWRGDGLLLNLSSNAPVELPRPAGPNGFRHRAGVEEAWLFTPPGECLLAGRTTAGLDRELATFALRLGALGFATLLLALAGGWFVCTRALGPIRAIERAASEVAAGALDARIPVAEPASELGRLSVALNDTFARLEAAFAQQARFTSDAAHELRTPVSLLLAQTQLALARARSADEYRETIATTQRAAQRMHGLIESLLALARLDASAEPVERRPADLAELGRDHLDLIKPLAEARGVALRGELAAAPCRVDAGRVGQILANLLDNAVKFSPAGGEVRVTTGRKADAAFVTVADDGPGIAPEHQPHVFERFYRADASRTRATGGAGLGLSICRGIADAHGAALTVESQPGHGSRFTLRIPDAAPRPA